MLPIGEKIQNLRQKRGWSQEDLASRAGIGRSALGNYEAGIRGIGLDVLEQIADAFGISLGELVNSGESSDAQQAREELADDPDRKALLDFARNGSASSIKQVRALIDALRATNPDFYDGDDPA